MSVTIAKKTAPPKHVATELTVISKVIKGDTYMVIADAAKEQDDEYVTLGLYSGEGSSVAVQPPYTPKSLKSLVSHNNVLNQCVHAMEVNIDGTGHEFVPHTEGEQINEDEKKRAEEFFAEPYPGQSFVSMRRDLRRDIESMGYGFFEVLRNVPGDAVSLRWIEGQGIRLANLGPPVTISRKVMRGGTEQDFKVQERPRRFMQVVNGKSQQYYKELGCPLALHRKTGRWEPEGTNLPPADQATEVLYFGADRDFNTPYFVPRWINCLPSIVGSRKAEEQNLELLDSGGMPPAIIFIQGGTMVAESAQQLRTYLSASNLKKGRAVVVELSSTSGTIDSGGSVQAKVERFGAERANDAMYANYDEACGEHVREAFRLPPLFLGKAADYNYATAVIAYQVAEAQVFGPERVEFDHRMDQVMKELGFKSLKFKSLPITLKSVDQLFAGLALLAGKVEDKEVVNEVNKAVGIDLTFTEPPKPPEKPVGLTDPLTGLPYDKPVAPVHPVAPPAALAAPKAKAAQPAKVVPIKRLEVLALVRKCAKAQGLVGNDPDEGQVETIRKSVESMEEADRLLFQQAIGLYKAHNHAHECA